MRRARKDGVGDDTPRRFARVILRLFVFFRVIADARAFDIFQMHNVREFFLVDAVGVVNEAVRIRHCQHLAAEGDDLFRAVLRDIAAAGNQTFLAAQRIALRGEHFFGEESRAETGRFAAY